jgi:hypothetical protein
VNAGPALSGAFLVLTVVCVAIAMGLTRSSQAAAPAASHAE